MTGRPSSSPRKLVSISVLIVAGGSLATCTPARKPSLHSSLKNLTAEDYPDVLDTWTRGSKLYQGLDNVLFATATYHASEFRRAFAVAFPDLYGHGGDITRRELVELTGDVERFHTFFVTAYTPDRKWNDFDKEDSIWRLTLRGSSKVAVDAAEVLPVKIDENLRAVYAYVDRFDEAYLVRFPLADPLGNQVIAADADELNLRVASALGALELGWDLVPGTTQ